MANDITFQLDIPSAESVLTEMAAPIVKSSADAVASRASTMFGSITTQPVSVEVTEIVGVNARGRGKRAIATVLASSANVMHDVLLNALIKSKDAGRIS